MILAEKGLPRGGAVGNELFDKLGSLGLTSFMQDVTRLRALEGELARTIQMMRSVKAARVHIVLVRRGVVPARAAAVLGFGGDSHRWRRRSRDRRGDPPSRRLRRARHEDRRRDGAQRRRPPAGVRLRLDGQVARTTCSRSSAKCRRKSARASTRTLTPYLSARNFQISVAARLNADKTQTNETIYNPDQRVERSVRVTKEQQSSQNAAGSQPAGVEANLPKQSSAGTEQKQSNDQTQKREELTNYEVSSKSIQTTSAGFVVQNLSVAVLVNRAALTASLGDKPAPEAVAAQVKEIEQLVASAAGLDKQRGDVVKISVVDFVDSSHDLEPAPGPSLVEIVARQTGAIVNAGAMVLVAGMLIWFGVRPGLKMLLAPPPAVVADEAALGVAPGSRAEPADRT